MVFEIICNREFLKWSISPLRAQEIVSLSSACPATRLLSIPLLKYPSSSSCSQHHNPYCDIQYPVPAFFKATFLLKNNTMSVEHDPLLFQPNEFDTEELRSLRYLYGYSLVTRENLVRHLSVLEEFPFLIDAIMTTCNGGTYHHTLHSDALISMLSKITYGTPTDLSLLTFELCSNGEGRINHGSVLRMARAARKLIRAHPLVNKGGTSNEQSSSRRDLYLANLQGPGPSGSSSTSPQSQEQDGNTLTAEANLDPVQHQQPQQHQQSLQQPEQLQPQLPSAPVGSHESESAPSSGLPPNEGLSNSTGVSQASGTRDISVQAGNLEPVSAAASAATSHAHGKHDDVDYTEYASIPGIATRNGGFEALGFPDDLVDSIFSSEKSTQEAKDGDKFLSYKEFQFKAKFIPEISRCFGMFDFLYFLVIAPIKSAEQQVTMEGHLKVSRKKLKVQRKFHNCYVHVRDRFLIITKENSINPWVSLPLWRCTTHIRGARKLTVSVESAKSHLRMHAINVDEAVQWLNCIRINSRGNHVYDSFAKPRKDNFCKWFVNAKAYYKNLITIIPKAEKQISKLSFIIGWAITPYLALERNAQYSEEVVREITDPSLQHHNHHHHDGHHQNGHHSGHHQHGHSHGSHEYGHQNGPEHTRTVKLVDLLLERARAGVAVRVLVWNETNWGFMLDSHKTKHVLEGVHENIEVVRHPSIVPLKWTHHQKMVVIDQRIAFLGGIDLVVGRYDDKWSRVSDLEGTIFPGNDYNNLILGGNNDARVTKLDRSIQPRLPWHDTAVCVVGQSAYDAATSFIQIWNHAADHVIKSSKYTRLVPHPPLHLELLARDDVEAHVFNVPPGTRHKDVSSGLTCQIIRSCSPWAFGQSIEASYYRGMLDTIRKARHFVYIQNQYFISSVMHSIPGNKISLAIVERISLAIRTKRKFRVYMVLPIHQAGPIGGAATRAIVKWTRHSIFHGKESICGRLKHKFPDVDVSEYISVCALRNWQVANHIAFTEMVYVHSKLLIADDQIVIIGSGNINDRSLRGARDSEIGVIISGGEQCDSVMDGSPFQASSFVRSLRIKLWRTHLGLYQMEHGYPLAATRPVLPRDPTEEAAFLNQMFDPIADATFQEVWKRTARWNTRIFKEVFGDALVENWTSVKEGHRKVFRDIPQEHLEKLATVHGHLIEFPGNMLSNDNDFTLWLLTKRLKVNLVV